MEREGVIPMHLLLATAAKVLCSAVFLPLAEVNTGCPNRQATLRIRLDAGTVQRIVTGYRDHHPGLDADWPAETERLLRLGPAGVGRTVLAQPDPGVGATRKRLRDGGAGPAARVRGAGRRPRGRPHGACLCPRPRRPLNPMLREIMGAVSA